MNRVTIEQRKILTHGTGNVDHEVIIYDNYEEAHINFIGNDAAPKDITVDGFFNAPMELLRWIVESVNKDPKVGNDDNLEKTKSILDSYRNDGYYIYIDGETFINGSDIKHILDEME